MYDEKDKKILSKLCKGITTRYFISLAISIICILTIVVATYYPKFQKLPDPVDFLNAKKGEYSKVSVSLLTDVFATYKNSSGAIQDKYYFISDGKYLYIVNLDSTTLQKLQSINDYTYGKITEKPENIEITGMAENMPSELKNLALKTYTGWFPESGLTKENFEDYFGSYVLNVKEKPLSNTFDNVLVVAGIVLVIDSILCLTFAISYFKSKKNQKKIMNSDNFVRFIENYNDPEKVEFEKQKMILTKEYLISYSYTLEVIEYKNILWMYPFIQKRNGFEVSRSIILLDKYGKKYTVCCISSGKKNLQAFDEIYQKIAEHCPNALFGYTSENIKATNRKNIDKTREEFEAKNTLQ